MKTALTLVVIFGVLAVSEAIRKDVVVEMPKVTTEKKGEYICYAHPLEYDETYIKSSLIQVNQNHKLVHHVSIGVCGKPASDTNLWHCSNTHEKGQNCDGAAINFVGWDDMIGSHDRFTPPKDLSIKVGRKTEYKYLLIEVHFAEINSDPNVSVANVTLTLSNEPRQLLYQSYLLLNSGFIPANKPHGVFTEIACPWNKPAVLAYRYYLHTHHNGLLVEGYLVRNGTWKLIGSQLSNAQPKETYNIPGGPIEIRTGDILTARCLYINKGSENIDFGLKSEMCNFNIEFGYRPKHISYFRRPAACMASSPDFSFCNHPLTSNIC